MSGPLPIEHRTNLLKTQCSAQKRSVHTDSAHALLLLTAQQPHSRDISINQKILSPYKLTNKQGILA